MIKLTLTALSLSLLLTGTTARALTVQCEMKSSLGSDTAFTLVIEDANLVIHEGFVSFEGKTEREFVKVSLLDESLEPLVHTSKFEVMSGNSSKAGRFSRSLEHYRKRLIVRVAGEVKNGNVIMLTTEILSLRPDSVIPGDHLYSSGCKIIESDL